MPISRLVTFPLFGILEGGRCACGNESCGRVGKHPQVAWGDLELGSSVPLPEPGAGVGLKTGAHPKGSGVFVVDLDSAAALDLFETLGPYDGGLMVETPRGWHLYFEHPGFHVKNSAGYLGKGIDIRGDGGFVVAPGSPHRSGGRYGDFQGELGPAPSWLLDRLRKEKAPSEAQHFEGDVSGAERHYHRALFAEYLRTAPPCVEGSGGDAKLFDVVQRGAYDLALPIDDVLELVRDVYDPRCSPPWGDELEERVHHKARCAKEQSTRPRAVPLPWEVKTAITPRAELPSFAPPLSEVSKAKPAEPKGSLGETWGGWDMPINPPEYLLEGLIPVGKVTTFFAEGGSVKTWSALSIAIAVASGAPWLDRYPVKKGKVLFLDYEDGPYEVKRRARILTGGTDVPDLGYLYAGPSIDAAEFWVTLGKKVIAEGVSLLVIDSLGASMPGDVDENATAFATGVKMAGRFTETGCGVLFVHHANKNGGMRGTSAARDQSDVVYKFEPVSETDDTKRMRMTCDKPGPQKKPKPVNVELSDSGLSWFDDEANDVGRNARGEKDVKEAVLLALASNGGMVAAALEKHLQCRTKAIADALRELSQEGKIYKAGYHGGYCIDDADKRRARIIAAAPDCKGTCAVLAREAFVSPDDVRAALKAGAIELRTGQDGGGFIVR